jgi:GT2 family glycosyltransferase
MTSAPHVSVIIPAYYSDGTLEACLEALRAQTFQNFETILVNSSPEDRTRQIIATRFPEVVFEQSPKRLLPHAARNRGVSIARGELLIFTDPDCIARPDWLTCLVEAYKAGHEVVGGGMGLDSRSWFERGVHLCKFSWVLIGLLPGPRWIIPTANACYSREVWKMVGPFDGDYFHADALLSWRARARGYQPWFEPGAIVMHRHEGSISSFWHQRLERGREFAAARIKFEHWSRLRVVVYLTMLPVLVLLVLVRAGRDALKSGWGLSFVLTLPLQLVGHLAWSLGEARTHWTLVTCGLTQKGAAR